MNNIKNLSSKPERYKSNNENLFSNETILTGEDFEISESSINQKGTLIEKGSGINKPMMNQTNTLTEEKHDTEETLKPLMSQTNTLTEEKHDTEETLNLKNLIIEEEIEDVKTETESFTQDLTRGENSDDEKDIKQCSKDTKILCNDQIDKKEIQDEIIYIKENEENKELQNTTVYISLSCLKLNRLNRENIEFVSETNNKVIEILNDEIVKVVSGNNEYNNNKNILSIENEFKYLYNKDKILLYILNLNLEKDEERFKIKVTCNNEKIISKYSFCIKKYQQLFIFSPSFKLINNNGHIIKNREKIKKYICSRNNKNIVFDLLNEKYFLTDLQKFIFYKCYLTKNNIDYLLIDLLEQTKKIFNKSKNLYLIFMLEFIIALIQKEENFDNLSENIRLTFENIFIDYVEKKEIKLPKRYDKNMKKYDTVVKIIENYNISTFNEKSIIGYYLFLLTYYQFTKQDKFNEIFNKIP
ncbi:hypothetical protein BCR36DRAFT_408399 [Piromyces finnis]|uniref:Uncharacterized protein n=1 Tax=Piromyces finnis TaxID=1754191 RepID=A0A1Y1VM88_9FUNG|nr:hypothetical protein BCR36DRAFT_408399 [Piromyces finnis]|eukprot:ORX60037.1 hypothetical protein BCR36DRAFT_408399 [Piromyces finnis]